MNLVNTWALKITMAKSKVAGPFGREGADRCGSVGCNRSSKERG